MPNEDSKIIRNVFIIIMIVGLVVFLIGAALSVKMLIVDRMNKETTTATITKITNNSTSVEYSVKNKIYRRTYTVYNSSYREGKEVKIYYSKSNPSKSFIAAMQYLILIVPGMGVILMGISGIGFIYIYMKYYKKYM